MTGTKLLYFGVTKGKVSTCVLGISHRFTFVICGLQVKFDLCEMVFLLTVGAQLGAAWA